jgi:hypothetical protein
LIHCAGAKAPRRFGQPTGCLTTSWPRWLAKPFLQYDLQQAVDDALSERRHPVLKFFGSAKYRSA